MNQIILEWKEAGHIKTLTLTDASPTKNPGTIRIGRDPSRCDLILPNLTVSGLHIEIFWRENRAWVRNLRDTNPPIINRQHRLQFGELPLDEGSTILLGEVELNVVKIMTQPAGIPPTLVVQPPFAATETASPPIAKPPILPTHPPDICYGLHCPQCQRISPYERLDLGCPWCGTSLAAAVSVVMPPER